MILFPPAMMSADYQTMQDYENIKSARSIRLIFPHGRMTALKISIFHRLTKLAPKVFPPTIWVTLFTSAPFHDIRLLTSYL